MKQASNVNRYTIYIVAAIVSLLISLWLDARTSVINQDAICYLYSAEYIGIGGLIGAMHLCPQAMWPFYSFFIYIVSQYTHLTTLTTAFVINALFSAVSVITFIAIAKELGANLRVMIFSAIVILLFHDFNILREDIIRDHGFWAAYLASIYFSLRFYKDNSWLTAIFVSISLMVATSFRLEGAIFLMLLPIAAWFNWQERITDRFKQFCQLNLVLFIGILSGAFYLLSHPDHIQEFGRLPEIIYQLHHSFDTIFATYQTTQYAISHAVLTRASLRDAGLVVILLTLVWYVITIVENLSFAYTFLVLYAWISRAVKFQKSQFLVLITYLLINLVITFAFFACNHFLAKRYLIALSLVCMLWIPFVLYELMLSKKPLQRTIFILAAVFIAISGFSSFLHFGHSKEYVRQAGDWLALNVPINAKLYVNDYQLMYYSQHEGNHIFTQYDKFKDMTIIRNGNWRTFDYLAIKKGLNDQDAAALIMQEIQLPPIQVFVSENGTHIYIFKVMHRENRK